MTNKIEEIRQILTMIEGLDWVDNQAVADEINARVWCADNDLHIVDMGSTLGNTDYYCATNNHDHVESVPKTNYLTSLDAIKGLEREGFLFQSLNYHPIKKDFCAEYASVQNTVDRGDGRFEIINPIYSKLLPTEHAARLYAVLLTWIYEEERNNETK